MDVRRSPDGSGAPEPAPAGKAGCRRRSNAYCEGRSDDSLKDTNFSSSINSVFERSDSSGFKQGSDATSSSYSESSVNDITSIASDLANIPGRRTHSLEGIGSDTTSTAKCETPPWKHMNIHIKEAIEQNSNSSMFSSGTPCNTPEDSVHQVVDSTLLKIQALESKKQKYVEYTESIERNVTSTSSQLQPNALIGHLDNTLVEIWAEGDDNDRREFQSRVHKDIIAYCGKVICKLHEQIKAEKLQLSDASE